MRRNVAFARDLFIDVEKMNEAMRFAAREAARLHKRLGEPLAVFKDGKVVLIPPEEIRIEDDDPTEPVRIYLF